MQARLKNIVSHRTNLQMTSPFDNVTLEQVKDCLGIKPNGSHWASTKELLDAGVLLTLKRWSSDHLHKKILSGKVRQLAGEKDGVSTIAYVTTAYKSDGEKAPSCAKLVSSIGPLCEFLGSVSSKKDHGQFDLLHTHPPKWELWIAESTTSRVRPLRVHPFFAFDVSEIPTGIITDKIEEITQTVLGFLDESVSHVNNCNNNRLVLYRLVGANKLEVRIHYPLSACTVDELRVHCIRMKRHLATHQSQHGYTHRLEIDTHTASRGSKVDVPFFGGNPFTPLYDTQGAERADVIRQSCPISYNRKEVSKIILSTTRSRRQSSYDGVDWVDSTLVCDEASPERKDWLGFLVPVIKHMVSHVLTATRMEDAAKENITCQHPVHSVYGQLDIGWATDTSLHECYMRNHGDTYCQYAKGAHPYESNAVYFRIDMSTCSVAQCCSVCKPPELDWRRFLWSGSLRVERIPRHSEQFDATDIVHFESNDSFLVDFIWRFLSDGVLWDREVDCIRVYDSSTGLWVKEGAAIQRLDLLIKDMHVAYDKYIRAHGRLRQQICMGAWRSQQPPVVEQDKVDEKQKEFIDIYNKSLRYHKNVVRVTKDTSQLIQKMTTCAPVHDPPQMESDQFLIPILYCQCVDVRTAQQLRIKPQHYFTNRMNTQMIDLEDPLVEEFKIWQMQVCCGDVELFESKLRVWGLCFTPLNFDRRIYFMVGHKGSNGKGSEMALLQHLMEIQSPSRGTTMNRAFLTKRGQEKQAASGPNPAILGLQSQTMGLVDEASREMLDNELLKSLVAGDMQKARQLYSKQETNIVVRATLLFNSNLIPMIDYTDNAMLDRAVFWPYNARWVAEPSGKDIHKQYVFQKDGTFKDTVATYGPAMFTLAVDRLKTHLNPGGQLDCPIPNLRGFAIPDSVKKYTEDITFHKHPLKRFCRDHLGRDSDSEEKDWVALGEVLNEFLEYSRQRNDKRQEKYDTGLLTTHLEQLGFDTSEDGTGRQSLMYSFITKPVIGNSPMVGDGDSYIPSSVVHSYISGGTYTTGNKRQRT
jgi:hypothetical protein